VGLQEGVNLHPRPETQHTTYLRFRQTYAAASFQRQGFEGGAGEIGLLALNDAGNIVRDLQLNVHKHLPSIIPHLGIRDNEIRSV
jgi:hypothetical protein